MRRKPASSLRHHAPRDTMWVGKGVAPLWATLAGVAVVLGLLANGLLG